MSSAISTKGADTKVGPYKTTAEGRPYTATADRGPYKSAAEGAATGGPRQASSPGLLPWQFFVLAALGCATAVNVMVRGQGMLTIVLVTLLVGSTALVGIAALRTLNPLVTDEDDRTAVIGGRTRAALEREKVLTLRAIKELEFDRAMGKVSDADFEDMSGRLRARAARLMRQLDAGAHYRDEIERDLAKRLNANVTAAAERSAKSSPTGSAAAEPRARASANRSTSLIVGPEGRGAEQRCECGTMNDADAKFCKSCGAKL